MTQDFADRYREWRITYQSGEQAARAAFRQIVELHETIRDLEIQLNELIENPDEITILSAAADVSASSVRTAERDLRPRPAES